MHMSSKGENTETLKLLFQLTTIAILVMTGMTVYEVLKQVIVPDITIWQSHIVTTVFSTICATIASYILI